MGVPPADDDWFSEPDARPRAEAPSAAAEDDWLEERESPRPAPLFDLREALDLRILVPAVLVIVFLVAILAAFGVFSGGGTPPNAVAITTAPPATTPTQPVVTPTTTAAQAPRPHVPTTTLKPGDTGNDVVLLQQALVRLGYLTGKADGDYGPATTQAVTAFQRAKGLTADGVFGPSTRRALAAALA